MSLSENRMQKVIEKIKKLNRLAQSRNHEETGNAAAFAAKLMSEYSINEAVIEASLGESNENVTDRVIDEGASEWKRDLSASVAKVCGAYAYRSIKNKEIVIVGKSNAVNGTKYLYELIVRQINYLANQSWTQMQMGRSDIFSDKKFVEPTAGSGKTWKQSFRVGCCVTVRMRIAEMIQRQEDELRIKAMESQQHTSAIAILDKNKLKIREHLKNQGVVLGYGNSATNRSKSGYEVGKEKGNKVNISSKNSGSLGVCKRAIGR